MQQYGHIGHRLDSDSEFSLAIIFIFLVYNRILWSPKS